MSSKSRKNKFLPNNKSLIYDIDFQKCQDISLNLVQALTVEVYSKNSHQILVKLYHCPAKIQIHL